MIDEEQETECLSDQEKETVKYVLTPLCAAFFVLTAGFVDKIFSFIPVTQI